LKTGYFLKSREKIKIFHLCVRKIIPEFSCQTQSNKPSKKSPKKNARVGEKKSG
jgi:hypothetical protein